METRVAVVGIIVEKNDSAEMINEILHEYGRVYRGKNGDSVPREKYLYNKRGR